MKNRTTNALRAHAQLLEQMIENPVYAEVVQSAANACVQSLTAEGKILFCGNGGSAADAQHLAAELSGRYLIDRAALFAEALHVNSSYLTAVGNDYGFDYIYSRAIEAKGRKGDVLVALSTSGRSSNIVEALKQARKNGLITISFTSTTDQQMVEYSDHYLAIPSDHTPRIQEMHILYGHVMCDLIEQKLFG